MSYNNNQQRRCPRMPQARVKMEVEQAWARNFTVQTNFSLFWKRCTYSGCCSKGFATGQIDKESARRVKSTQTMAEFCLTAISCSCRIENSGRKIQRSIFASIYREILSLSAINCAATNELCELSQVWSWRLLKLMRYGREFVQFLKGRVFISYTVNTRFLNNFCEWEKNKRPLF